MALCLFEPFGQGYTCMLHVDRQENISLETKQVIVKKQLECFMPLMGKNHALTSAERSSSVMASRTLLQNGHASVHKRHSANPFFLQNKTHMAKQKHSKCEYRIHRVAKAMAAGQLNE